MTGLSNETLAQCIAGHQQQLEKLSKLLNELSSVNIAHSETVQHLQQQILGFRAAFQVFAELVMAASPDVKQQVAEATTQVLARPSVAANETLRELLAALNTAAIQAPRTSPEGRRANFQVVSTSEKDENGEA